MVVFETLISVTIISLVSFSGLLVLALREKQLKAVILELVAFAVGALLGSVFLHILPEVSEELGFGLLVGLLLLGGFLLGFIMEKFIHWHHCHGSHCDHGEPGGPAAEKKHLAMHAKPCALVNIFGDALHNFIDGVLIAAAYMTSTSVGVATTIAVLLHEIPQEIGDFAVLIHAGWSRWKALMMNFASALTAILGAAITLLVGVEFREYVPYVMPVAGGLFIYLAASDLVPELHKETKLGRGVAQLLAVIAGIAVMSLFLLY
ncbi:ZIP family metal transporter [Candidatus Woesearchaeota archaeon]|nr:ZIP family metal transporter [Candidatus Woesearchaeota archaeon]